MSVRLPENRPVQCCQWHAGMPELAAVLAFLCNTLQCCAEVHWLWKQKVVLVWSFPQTNPSSLPNLRGLGKCVASSIRPHLSGSTSTLSVLTTGSGRYVQQNRVLTCKNLLHLEEVIPTSADCGWSCTMYRWHAIPSLYSPDTNSGGLDNLLKLPVFHRKQSYRAAQQLFRGEFSTCLH